MLDETMFAVPADQLVEGRRLSHAAAQWPSRAARANLDPAPDDSHSNLGWHDGAAALVSHALDDEGRLQLGFSFASRSLIWLAGGAVSEALSLETADEAAAKTWCDARLSAAGLQTTDQAVMPYELDTVRYAGFARPESAAAIETLGAWYASAEHALEQLVGAFADRAVSGPTVRCWPHHFDLATLFVLEEGDPETARSIGVGLSPGDGSYAEPYFYCTPWPAPPQLPEAAPLTHWHTEGFTSLVCPASRVDATTDLSAMLTAAVALAHEALS